ncbi:malate dehydrogenase, mitochondrial-like isoform X1 [Cimex lectularius]|uniref:Malate dehydrogenase, mitochondrial n=1 Tax=Cimex lectularius TaxID=79782 RepID=A0A8I6SDZ3_CIMLE|nr:malate dehydrogenase, mitochondrial-like isoform X1 [Cimex lectularius]
MVEETPEHIIMNCHKHSKHRFITVGRNAGRWGTGTLKGLDFSRGLKIAVLGGMGQIGHTLCLMLKQSPWFDEIAIQDSVNPKGLAMELNHIDTQNIVTSHEGHSGLKTALKGADIVMIVAGHTTEKYCPGSKDDLFTANCRTVYELARSCAVHCPKAFIAVCTNPVNSTLPITCEVFKRLNRFVDPCKMFGVTTLTVVRANTLVSEVIQVVPETVEVPIIGGHSPSTMVPVLSQAKPCAQLTTEEVVRITRALQTAGDEVQKAKNNQGTASLSMGFAATRFAVSLAKALSGQDNIIECAYLMSNIIPELPYFATPVQLGPCGVQKNLGIPDLSSYECCLLETAIPFLKRDIESGENFIADVIKNKIIF